jgi:dihydroneopterin aldolase
VTVHNATSAGAATRVIQEVRVRDIRVAADIGVHPHEIGRAQALIVEVRLGLTPLAIDQLSETVDYNDVVAYALALGQERISLIETFARRLAEACLAHSRVLQAEVTVEKPGVMPNGQTSARVVLRRPS